MAALPLPCRQRAEGTQPVSLQPPPNCSARANSSAPAAEGPPPRIRNEGGGSDISFQTLPLHRSYGVSGCCFFFPRAWTRVPQAMNPDHQTHFAETTKRPSEIN